MKEFLNKYRYKIIGEVFRNTSAQGVPDVLVEDNVDNKIYQRSVQILIKTVDKDEQISISDKNLIKRLSKLYKIF